MKRIKYCILFATLMVTCITMCTACSSDPVKPKNENTDKLHDEPAKMSVQLIECHLHQDWHKIGSQGGPHANPTAPTKYLKRRQEMVYELTPKGWQLAKGSQKKFYVQRNGEYKSGKKFTPAPVYLLFINYYNQHGELMNGQFATGGQEHIHQHFFAVNNVAPTFDGKSEEGDEETTNQIDYIYADTNPWNMTFHSGKAQLIGETNPIGLKGVIRFLRDRKEYNLQIKLYHGFEGKASPKTGTFAPWHKPTSRMLQMGEWDVNVNFPVVVFWERDEWVNIDEEQDPMSIPENSLDEESNRTIQSIMHTFGISWTEALNDYYIQTFKSGDGESSQIWL